MGRFQEHLPVGTMVFMAPETFTNPSPQLTGQTDVWALGVILTWIVTAVEILGCARLPLASYRLATRFLQHALSCLCMPRLGSLQHPNLDREDGRDFCVKWIDMPRASMRVRR